MIRQILNRFPRNKPSKSDGSDGGESALQTSRIVHKFSLDDAIKATMGDDRLLALPLLKDVPGGERQELFVAKLSRCCVPLGVSDSNDSLAEKEAKREILEELVDHIASGDIKFTGPIVEELFRMISANLFRALPPSPHENGGLEFFDHGEEDPVLDPDWPLLRCVYELLLRFVLSIETDVKAARRYLDRSFIIRLLGLFDSEDYREREYLKTILHRIYGKFMVHRPFIRKAINNIFYGFIFETERCNGIPELLEILGTVITGFAMPLKEEHKMFLVRALIPLHKPKSLPFYHPQLSYCITQFVEKDGELADAVIRGLLKYWPITNSRKEVMFLSELEEILEVTPPSAFQCSVGPLFRQISRCLNSSHFQVAERAFFLWNNVQILNWVSQNRSVILPLIFTALEGNGGSVPHWNPIVHGLTVHARKALPGFDRELFQECVEKFEEEEAKAQKLQEMREQNWRHVEDMASSSGAGETMVASQ